METIDDQRAREDAVSKAYEEYVFPCVAPLYDQPLALVEGHGVWLTDARGRRYLDFFSGILTTSLGHCHPEVTEAVAAQMNRLGHISTLYLNQQQVEIAQRLADIAPGDLTQTLFTNSGSEAVETAVMLACLHTGQSEIIALRRSYSGRSLLATNLTGVRAWRPLPSALAGIKHVMSPYPYRCPFVNPCDASCLDALERDLIEVIETTTSGRPAAFLAETIQGVGGYIVPPPGYFQRMAKVIRSYGGLFIIDEVQTGFGRTGRHWFGIEHWGVTPDIMIMAKSIANGFPVGATITRPEIARSWTAKTISTYGGNPVAMAAAIAVNKVMLREDVPRLAEAQGRRVAQALQGLRQRHHWIGDVRGMGLMQALELVEDRKSKTPSPSHARRLLEAAKEQGLLLGLGGLQGHVIRLGPSLLISPEELEDGLHRLERACRQVDSPD